MKRVSVVGVALVALVACKSIPLPPITIAVPPPSVLEAKHEPAPAKQRATLAFEVLNACSGGPIDTAFASVAEIGSKQADLAGYIKFELDAEGAIYVVSFAASGYEEATGKYQLNANRQFPVKLAPVGGCPKPEPPQAPVVEPVAPPSATGPVDPMPAPVFFTECGPRAEPLKDRHGCLRQVAAVSVNWRKCEAGHDEVACHLFVREVAAALAAGDRRWGLITKRSGEAACTTERCGRDIADGFGEDVVAYLPDGAPRNRWLGADIVGCLGCPTPTDPNFPSFHWGELNPADNREHNLWVKLPDRK